MPEPAKLIIRDELLPSDRQPIGDMVARSLFFRDDEVAVALELVDDRLKKGEKSDYLFLVAEREGKVVGWACYGKIACTVHSYDLYWIVVDPETQRGGIGRALMEASEERIRKLGGKRVYVETSGQQKYVSTRYFYEACGYKAESILKDFYAPGDDRYTYVKAL